MAKQMLLTFGGGTHRHAIWRGESDLVEQRTSIQDYRVSIASQAHLPAQNRDQPVTLPRNLRTATNPSRSEIQ